MSAPTNLDFNKGVDFLIQANLAQADLNQLVDLAVPYAEVDVLEGKGLVIATQDDALDTPSVPNADFSSETYKWKRYIWLRRPHSTATSTTPILYVWDENATSVATYLKWKEVGNATDLQAQIDALDATVTSLSTTVEGQVAQISAINAVATEASNDAEAATLAVESTIPDLQTRITAVENENANQNTNITTAQNKADQAYAAAFNVTDAQLADTLDLSGKTLTMPHPIVKAMGKIVTGTLQPNSFNIASISNPATGYYTWNFTTPMPNTDYIVMVTLLGERDGLAGDYSVLSQTVNGFTTVWEGTGGSGPVPYNKSHAVIVLSL